MAKEEKRFTFQDHDYIIKPANALASIEAQKVYNKAFKKAIEEGAILKKSLEDHMRRQGLWDDDKQEEYENLLKRSADIEYKIDTQTAQGHLGAARAARFARHAQRRAPWADLPRRCAVPDR